MDDAGQKEWEARAQGRAAAHLQGEARRLPAAQQHGRLLGRVVASR